MNRTTHNESSAPMKKYSELTIDELATITDLALYEAVCLETRRIDGVGYESPTTQALRREVEQVVGGER